MIFREIFHLLPKYFVSLFIASLFLFPQSIFAQDSIIDIELKSTNDVNALRQNAFKYFSNEDYKTALKFIEKGLEITKKSEDRSGEAPFLTLEAYVYLNRGLPQKAMLKFSEVQSLGIELNVPSLITSSYHGRARAYIELKLYNQAIDLLKEGIEKYIQDDDSHTLGIFNNALGMAYSKLELPEKALEHYRKFYESSLKSEDSASIIYALVNIGEVYNDMGNFANAENYFMKADSLNLLVNDAQAKGAILGNLAKMYQKTGDLDKSLRYLQKAIDVCYEYANARFQPDNLKLLVEVYKDKGLIDSALWASNVLLDYNDSVFEADRINTIQYLNSYFSMEEKLHKSELVAQQLRNRTIMLSFSIAISILFVLLLVLLFSRYKLKNRLYLQERNKLNLTIDEKNRELVGKILNQSQADEISQNIFYALEKALEENNTQDTKKILSDIKANIIRNRPGTFDWENFRIHFEQVHPQFFDKLKNTNKELTINDLRHCAYIRMNLATKEIAGMLNVSDRSVQTARYRIKKKLMLSHDIDLSSYLHEL